MNGGRVLILLAKARYRTWSDVISIENIKSLPQVKRSVRQFLEVSTHSIFESVLPATQALTKLSIVGNVLSLTENRPVFQRSGRLAFTVQVV